MKLTIAYLYPAELNIYGDRGNILALWHRATKRGITVEVLTAGLGDTIAPDMADIFFMGGGQDIQQVAVCDDLHANKASALITAAKEKAVFLTICGGYQLLGHYYKPHQGEELKGLSVIDAHTVAGDTRFIGNITLERPDGSKVVGFENHSGCTYLGEGVTPLGKVVSGNGNNGEDGFEGVAHGNIYGTYLHGSLLPKNPVLTDELIGKALLRQYSSDQVTAVMTPLEHTFEDEARQVAMTLK